MATNKTFFVVVCWGFLFRKYFNCDSFGNAGADHAQFSLLWRSVCWMSACVFQRLNIDFYAGHSIFSPLKFNGTKPIGETAGWAYPRSFEGSLNTPSGLDWNWEMLRIFFDPWCSVQEVLNIGIRTNTNISNLILEISILLCCDFQETWL